VVRARVQASAADPSPELHMPCRRQVRPACTGAARVRWRVRASQALALLGFAALSGAAPAAFADEEKVLCDAACVQVRQRGRLPRRADGWAPPARATQGLDKLEMVTLPSGLKYRDIVVGTGPSPEPGFQARAAGGTGVRPALTRRAGCGWLRGDDAWGPHLRKLGRKGQALWHPRRLWRRG